MARFFSTQSTLAVHLMAKLKETPVKPRQNPLFRRSLPCAPRLFAFSWTWLTFFVALWLSWHLLAKFDFGYPLLYQHTSIKQTIDTYAPQNRYKHDFETTTDTERKALFHHIAQAVQLPPDKALKKLKAIHYTDHQGNTIPLLRTPELLHLVDVSYLIQRLNAVGQSLALIWIGLTSWLLLRKRCFPNRKQATLILLAGLGILGIFLISFGPTEVFYQLHRWIFPLGHPWFFYYQDSLMSTLMAAPTLFGWIALLLLLFTLAFFYMAQQIFKSQACI